MATNLATRGWQRAACPSSGGTAGYALDANDLWLMDVVFGQDSAWAQSTGTDKTSNYFINQADRQLYSIGSNTLVKSTERPLFGKPASKYLGSCPTGAPNINFGTGDFTISAWINYLYTSRVYNLHQSSSISDFSGIITTNDVFKYAREQYISGQGWQPVAVITTSTPVVTNRWYYVSLIRQSGILYLYVDGVLCGQAADGAAYNGTVGIAGSGNAWLPTDPYGYIRDMRVSNIARDGSFVPGNVFGY